MAELSKISILIKTLLRDAHLCGALQGILRNLIGARIIVVDDGRPSKEKSELYGILHKEGHYIIELPFDSGFGAKSNAAIKPAQKRPYLLIGSDDFDFSTGEARDGILKLIDVLESDAAIDIASGRVNGYPYEGWLIDYGSRIIEERVGFGEFSRTPGGTEYHPCDLTVNYSLIRSRILGFGDGQIHWDSRAKIGQGEHGRFFIDAMRAGRKTAYVRGVNINEVKNLPVSKEYAELRARAKSPSRICFDEAGIKEYVCFDGRLDYKA